MTDLVGRAPGGVLHGDPDHRVERFVHPAEVAGERDLCLLMAPGALAFLQPEDAPHACAVVDAGLAEAPEAKEILSRLKAYITVDRPRYALACLTPLFRSRSDAQPGVHPSAVVEDGAELGDNVSIAAGAYIGAGAKIGAGSTVMVNAVICERAVIGEGCLIYPGVYIGHEIELGNRVIVHPNACLGGDGFAFESAARNGSEEARKVRVKVGGKIEPMERIESIGTLRIGDDVEIGACATIDRSTLGATVIGGGTKIDNLVQIGHGNQIGGDVVLCAQVGLAGSSTVGDGAVLAGKVGVADHRKIGANSMLMAKSGVTRDIPDGEIYYGMPARPVRETLRSYSLISQLDAMKARIAALEKEIGAK